MSKDVDFRLHPKGINSPYAKNGRRQRAIKRMEIWQHMLNNGCSIAKIVNVTTQHRKDVSARYQYKERIIDLVQTGELKDPHGVVQGELA